MHLTPHSAVRWFAPPDLPGTEIRRRARALWLVSWPFFLVVTVVLAIAAFAEPETLSRRAVTISSVGALIAILHAISRTGRPLLASWILVIGLTLIVTQRAWGTGGIHAPVAVFYALFIVMAAVLIGMRGGIVTAAVALSGAVFLAVASALGWLAPKPGAGSALGALLFTLLAIGLAVVVQGLIVSRTRRPGLGPDAAQMLAHDMRSPMQALLAHLESLRDGARGESAIEVENAIKDLNALNRMADSFIDASRIEAGEMPVKRSMTDLSEVALSVVESFRIIQRPRDMVVEAYGDARCACDAALTRRIIENLVGNAMKYTEVHERVRVIIAGGERSVSITVKDEGPGIPEDQRSRIFEPYFSADGPQNGLDAKSSGIGLAFCRLAAEAQGGTIRVEDSHPRGSAFVVQLPR